MKMNEQKLDAFCEMMKRELNKIDCDANFDTDSNYLRTFIRVSHRNHIGTEKYAIIWKEADSLTGAAVPILVDVRTKIGSTCDSVIDKYVAVDIAVTNDLYDRMSLTIKDVIFNPPATIVFWMDGTKTVVKDQGEVFYDPEKGMAMAVAKKAFGNQGNYYNQFAKYLDIYEKKQEDESINSYANTVLNDLLDKFRNSLTRINYNTVSNEKKTKIDTKIVFKNRFEADVALDTLRDCFKEFGVVSVSDLYKVAEIKCDHTYNRFGWKDYNAIHNAKVVKVKGGYMIDLPEPVELD